MSVRYKITEKQVERVVKMAKETDLPNYEIADALGISKYAVGSILKKKGIPRKPGRKF